MNALLVRPHDVDAMLLLARNPMDLDIAKAEDLLANPREQGIECTLARVAGGSMRAALRLSSGAGVMRT